MYGAFRENEMLWLFTFFAQKISLSRVEQIESNQKKKSKQIYYCFLIPCEVEGIAFVQDAKHLVLVFEMMEQIVSSE